MSPGAARPGGRTAEVHRAVLRATEELLVESGLAGLELTVIAERAGVGKSTVYRRWGSVPAVVADLLTDMADQSVARADTGSLRADLRANAQLVRDTLSDPRQGPLFKAIIAAATFDPRTAEALAGFYERRVAEWARCVDAAVVRQEVSGRIDACAVIRSVSAPLYYQLLTSRTPLTRRDATRAADAALAALYTGVFTVRDRPHTGSTGTAPGTAVR